MCECVCVPGRIGWAEGMPVGQFSLAPSTWADTWAGGGGVVVGGGGSGGGGGGGGGTPGGGGGGAGDVGLPQGTGAPIAFSGG
jgi:hypothetical protein